MERFYSALYRKLLDPQLSTSPRHAMFLNLLFQTLKEDEVVNRVKVSLAIHTSIPFKSELNKHIMEGATKQYLEVSVFNSKISMRI